MRISDWSSDVCSSDLRSFLFMRCFSKPESDDLSFAKPVDRDDIKIVVFALRNGRKGFSTQGRGNGRNSVVVTGDGDRLAAQAQIGRASCRESGCQYV